MDNQETQKLMTEATFGIEVESFLGGPIGRFLMAKAHEEIDEALLELRTVDPCDAKRITALQNKVHRAESIDKWLAEAVQEGWAAEETLRQNYS